MIILTTRRVLPIEGTFNFRDLGGYPTTDGRQTRWRMMYRSDSLHRVTALVELELRSMVDLRYPKECAQDPCASLTGVAYHALPLFEDPQRATDGTVPELDAIYRVIVDTRQPQLVRVLDTLASADALPAVVFCTAGKDRTGVVVALLLGLLGVERSAIVADYAVSASLLADSPLGDRVRASITARGLDPVLADRLLVSPPDHMERLLSYVDETYGGVEALAIRAGLAPQRIEDLRTALLE
ncbi:MAG: tyrosine-protein phosphatase [Chloroflexi bacterium]|nr:tyrosine-protein phosphatase [Chloroflexota bacterium]